MAADHGATIPPSRTPPISRMSGSETPAFDDYVILEEIARGGMGVVYRARQRSIDRIVALKTVLCGDQASDAQVRLLMTEAQAAGQLSHPGIVPVYDVGQKDGYHYFSMPFFPGGSLADRIVRSPMDPDEAAAFLKTAATTIQFAHDHGIVHRDIKPANILIDQDGQPRITDFGIAGRIGESEDPAGRMIGTPEFMSPEQASGQAGGPSTDIYSIGATLYCLLTGRPPFQSHNPLDTAIAVLEADPVPPRKLNPRIPRDLELICMKCLQKTPERRYATAQEVADELERFLEGEPVHVHPVGNVGRFLRWMRRQPKLAAMATGLVLSFTGGLAVSIYYNFQFRMQREIARAAQMELEFEVRRARHFQKQLNELISSERGLLSALQYSSLAAVTAAGAAVRNATDADEQKAAVHRLLAARESLSAEHADRLTPLIDTVIQQADTFDFDRQPLTESVDRLRAAVRELWQPGSSGAEAADLIRRNQYSRVRQLMDVITADGLVRHDVDRELTALKELLEGEMAVVAPDRVDEPVRNLAEALTGWHAGTMPDSVRSAVQILRQTLDVEFPADRSDH